MRWRLTHAAHWFVPHEVLYPGRSADSGWARYHGVAAMEASSQEMTILFAVDVPMAVLNQMALGVNTFGWKAPFAIAIDPEFIASPWSQGCRTIFSFEPREMHPLIMERSTFANVQVWLSLEQDEIGATWGMNVEVPGIDGGPTTLAFHVRVGNESVLRSIARRVVLGRWRATLFTDWIGGDDYRHRGVDGLTVPVRDVTADLARWLAEFSTPSWPLVFTRPSGLDILQDAPETTPGSDARKPCLQCGKILTAGSRFCSHCGTAA